MTTSNPGLVYVSEFLAPDGSKRRPLIERVPECRPQMIDADGDAASLDYQYDHLRWKYAKTYNCYSEEIESYYAAALLRCAVEDFLRKHGTLELIDDNPLRPVVWIEMKPWPNDPSTSPYHHFGQSDESIHEALNAAGHLVADKLGITQ